MNYTSIITKIAIFVAVISSILLGYSFSMFATIQNRILTQVLSKSQFDAVEIIESYHQARIQHITESMTHRADLIAKITNQFLKKHSFEELKDFIVHFIDLKEIEILFLKIVKSGISKQIVIKKEKDEIKISEGDLKDYSLLHLLYADSNMRLDDGSWLLVKMYFSDEKLIQNNYNAVSTVMNEALKFEQAIKNDFYENSRIQAIIHILLGIVLIGAVSFALLRLNNDLIKANNRLKDTNIKLQNSLIELESALNSLKKTQSKLIESEKMAALGNLVAGVAHELKTPIGVSITAASSMEDRTKKFLKQIEEKDIQKNELKEFSEMIEEGNKIIVNNLFRASEIIDTFKQISIDQTKMEKRLFELKEYILSIIYNLKPSLKGTKHQILVNSNEPIYLNSYPGAVYQIFINLITNSLQHGFKELKNGIIKIHLKKLEDCVEIDYKDNGIGIDKENLKKIFEPFFTTSRNKGNTGLGMHIVYNTIVHKLNGSIKAIESNSGAHFKIIIPLESK